ncbi:molybdenum cofactor sulfurase 3 [Copidosoma floridanum]|uniref:molybdenum cofactor sulfurase 3 n=1 Tax=Copidosoma floridanum TaxID=29053 RepID=UPI0006C9A6AB|nr:molybdenum cofactor sulfurase 3 [Copidosoma floridanum]
MDELSYSPVYDEKTLHFLDQQFSRINDECYVDHAGATLYSNEQIKKSSDDLLQSLYTNPHSHGVNGNLTEDIVDNVRYRILDHFHTNQDEYSVIFTSGSTASLKLVAETFNFNNDGSAEAAGNFVYLQDNHTSVLGMRDVTFQRGAKVVCIDHISAFKLLGCNNRNNDSPKDRKNNSLFVYPAQCNFSGLKYPLNWIKNIKQGCLNAHVKTNSNWFILLDAACYAGTSDLNLSYYKPDFICLSFYKLFGYPTGLGALLVKNDSAFTLQKTFYGGGTVDIVLSSKMHHVKRQSLSQRFEDGTISFLSIISLQYGFQILSSITMKSISEHVFSLARYLHHSLLLLHHENGAPVVKLYADTNYKDKNLQGGIVSFNLLRANGDYVGYMEVSNIAALHKIHLRTGCFCNPGTCQRHLGLTDRQILKNYDTGFTCGGTSDLINGIPTGAVRISFGYMSTVEDAKIIIKMIKQCFVSGKEVLKVPKWWNDFEFQLSTKYKGVVTKIDNDFSPIKTVSNEKSPDCQNVITNYNIEVRDRNCRLAKIFIYPIKSCGAYEVQDSWKLTSKGLLYDREWMIVTSAGVSLTQKHEVRLCLIKPVIDLKNNELILNYPDVPSIKIPLLISSYTAEKNEICKGKVCRHKVEGIDCGIEVSEWLSLALGRPNLKLIRQWGSVKQELSFASQSQYLLVNLSSISWLADRIPKTSDLDKSTMLHRFRSNFAIEGCAPFKETNWKMLEIGNCQFEVEGICNRCQMICIDQKTSEKTVEPLRTLAEEFCGKIKFGIYLANKNNKNNVLKVGEEINFN